MVSRLICGGLIALAVFALLVPAPYAWGIDFWETTVVDSVGDVGQYTSLAILPSGYPAISYYDSTHEDLKYAWYDGTSWQTATVDYGGVATTCTSLAILPSGYPAIVYADWIDNVKYAWYDGSSWHPTAIDYALGANETCADMAILPSGYPAVSYADRGINGVKYAWYDGVDWQKSTVVSGLNTVGHTSLAILPSDHPAISYRADGGLRYAWYDGAAWQTNTIDGEAGGQWYHSLAVLPSGEPVVSYWDYNMSPYCLRYAWFDGATWRGTFGGVDDDSYVGHYNTLAVLPTGRPAIAYENDYCDNLRYTWHDGSSWKRIPVDRSAGVGEYCSLAVLPSGQPAISYYDSSSGDLKFATVPGPPAGLTVSYTAIADTVVVDDFPAYREGFDVWIDYPMEHWSLAGMLPGAYGQVRGIMDFRGRDGCLCQILDCYYTWCGDATGQLTGTLTIDTSPTRPVGTWLELALGVSAQGDPGDAEDYHLEVRRGGLLLARIDPSAPDDAVVDVQAGETLTFECFASEEDWSASDSEGYTRQFEFDLAVQDAGLVITPQNLAVLEGGSAEFTVALPRDPNGPVSVDVSFESGDPDIAVATAMPLTFDSSNYWIAQPVTLTAAEDLDQLEGSAVFDIAASSGFRPAQLEAREDENDVPPVLYVDASATGAADGTSWTDAYPELAEALAFATAFPAVDEIHVADGTYTPDPSGLADPREATFQLLNGVMIEGGYAGFGAPDPDVRDIVGTPTVLSGDIGTPDDNADNCYHVVTGNGTDATAVLDGVTITAGNADAPAHPHDDGGGMLNTSGSPTVNRCTFVGNTAVYAGGGMHNYASSPAVTNCAFNGNTCDHVGGGMNNSAGSNPTLVNCTFAGNAVVDRGGAMHNWQSSPTLINCTIAGNSAGDDGGGLRNYDNSPTIANCILWGNLALDGPQIYNDGGASPIVTYSCIEGGWNGEGNIDADPQLVRSTDPGPDGQWDGVDDDYGDLHLELMSPCINAGDPNGDYAGQTDLDGDPRVLFGRVDIGADECAGPAGGPSLVASDPPQDGTLPKIQENIIWLTFDWPIDEPPSAALHLIPIPTGGDLGGLFLYSVESDGRTLRAFEDGPVLANQTWYRVTPTMDFNVANFALDLCVLWGDANGSGRVTTADYSEVKAYMGEYTDARYDLNGSGRVTTADYGVVKSHLGERAPTKP